MIKVIPFKPGHQDFLKPKAIYDRFPTLLERLDVVYENPNVYPYTLVLQNQPIAIAGLNTLLEGVADVWAVVSDDVRRRPLEFHKRILQLIETGVEKLGLRRIQMTVHEDHEEGHRWAKSLGFRDEALLRKYGPLGTDMVLYARIIE